MQIRCAACSQMVDTPPVWDGAAFDCPACGHQVTVAKALAPQWTAHVPEGLELSRTPEGSLRVSYGCRNPFLIAISGASTLGMGAYLIYSSAQRFSQGSGTVSHIWFPVAYALLFLFLLWITLRGIFGRHALEVDAGGITKCFRLPPLPERRKHLRAEDIQTLRVATLERAKPGDRSPRWLEADVAGKRVILAMNLAVPQLEWLRDCISAVVKPAGQQARP